MQLNLQWLCWITYGGNFLCPGETELENEDHTEIEVLNWHLRYLNLISSTDFLGQTAKSPTSTISKRNIEISSNFLSGETSKTWKKLRLWGCISTSQRDPDGCARRAKVHDLHLLYRTVDWGELCWWRRVREMWAPRTHSSKAPRWSWLLILEAYLKQQIIFPDSPLFNYSSHFSWRSVKQKYSIQPIHCYFFCSNSASTFGVSREGSNRSGIFTAALKVSSVQNVPLIMNDFNEKIGEKKSKNFQNPLGFKGLRKWSLFLAT